VSTTAGLRNVTAFHLFFVAYFGLPDLQAVKDGRTLYIEIKRRRPPERQAKNSSKTWRLLAVFIFLPVKMKTFKF
jgi:hypothetical protein